MSLLIRINLVFGGVFLLAAAAAGYACWGILEGNARREALAEAALMIDSAVATRDYTASEILPLLGAGTVDYFSPAKRAVLRGHPELSAAAETTPRLQL
jgi:hypothetical protein